MFIPLRRTMAIYRSTSVNAYGEHQYTLKQENVGWAPIYMRDDMGKSSVRADSSATKGRAQETQADYRLIIERFHQPQKDDWLVLDSNTTVVVRRVHERMDIVGRLHHWEVECDAT